jgi:pyridoxine 4-dehydrogenase
VTATTPLPTTFAIGGDLPVRRLGYGTMQLTGTGHWGPPPHPGHAVRLLRHAYHQLGINHLDTADAYGPHTVEELLRRALHPYPDDLLIATKGGLTRSGPHQWAPCGRPAYLRQCVELSLRRLGLDYIGLYYLHRVDPQVPLAEQVGALADLQRAGKIRHIGLSKVTIKQIAAARAVTPVAAVQNPYTLHTDDPVLAYCEQVGIAYVAYRPLDGGTLVSAPQGSAGGLLAQTILRSLLGRSPVLLPIPATTRITHLDHNAGADSIEACADLTAGDPCDGPAGLAGRSVVFGSTGGGTPTSIQPGTGRRQPSRPGNTIQPGVR